MSTNADSPSLSSLPLDRSRVPELVLETMRALHKAGKQAFLAGGAVRDLARLALGQVTQEQAARPNWPADFDVATDARPEEMMKIFPRAIPTGIQHGTVTVIARGKDAGGNDEEHKVELTTFRGEGPYLDGRRPSAVSFLGDIEGDLARRDFTVNAMAWDPLAPGTTGLRDPFGGISDLRARVLRAVGDARDRFAEDGLRSLRAARFAATLRLALEHKTAQAIPETLLTFDKVARERVRDELDKLLSRGLPPSRGLRLLLRTQLLERIAPQLARLAREDRQAWRRMLRALDASPADLLVRYALLLSPLGVAAAARLCDALKFPPRLRDRIALLIREMSLVWTGLDDAEGRRALARITPPELPALFAARRALAVADGAPVRDEGAIAQLELLLAQKPPLTIQELAIDGRALMDHLSLAPGPALGRVLRGLLDATFIDPSLNSAETLLRLASDMLRAQSTSNPHP